MNYNDFKKTLTLDVPPANLPVLQEALWQVAKDDWESAHNIAQSREGTRAYDRLHAYLHRVEGDTWNAGYWYRRAGAEVFKGTLEAEWEELARQFAD